jgi:polysaccharide export outer membrane protein
MNQIYDTRIREDDLLTISVSSWDPTVVTPFNPPSYSYYQPADADVNNASMQNLFTYLVGRDGFITFPVIGKIHLAGLSVDQAGKKIQELVMETVPDALVDVQIINFKVGIFGEVSRTNVYSIRNNRISILDLIAMAGDLTINANRKNILLIRENNGVKEFARIDMTDPNIFASPYFYLQQNDLVYVEPNRAKIKNANYSSSQQYSLSIVSTVMTGVNIVATIILALSKK